MRATSTAAALLILAVSPALAQTQTQAPPPERAEPKHAPTGEKPIDHGPYTPEANRAYQGGGVVLEGQPGGPAPKPEPTPPGHAPRGSVPQ